MAVEIQIRHDRQRGCGWRKEGGIYLVSGGVGEPCGKLSLPLDKCPTCSCGIKFARGWTWIDAETLFSNVPCKREEKDCVGCPLNTPNPDIKRAGLLWIGEKFYKTPADWIKESRELGISRRIHSVPNDFEVGKTWVAVAHIKAIKKHCDHGLDSTKQYGIAERAVATRACELCDDEGLIYTPGIFQMFQPTAIEYVVKGDESDDELEKLAKRGFTLIKVERVTDTPEKPFNFDDVEECETTA